MRKYIQIAIVRLIEGYQFLARPWMPSACRFWPSCSDYAKQAIGMHGVIQGVFFGIVRLLKCHPFSKGGIDIVPRKTS